MLDKTLGHYQIISQIGKGGMGEVYLAKDLKLGRDVAIKVLPEEFARDAARVTRFQQEAKLLASLNHPHICTIHDIDEHAGQHFIAMELLEGRTLNQSMRERHLTVDEILTLMLEVTDGLAAAHAKGIIHRDIKPMNLFITAAGHVKILDFGLAKLVPEGSNRSAGERASGLSTETTAEWLTSPGMAVGTVAYMSPEQALGKELDARTDLFSLGVVLYEMAAGRLPFQGETPAAQIDRLLHQVPTSPVRLNPDVPDILEQIIQKAIEKDREIRYQSATDLLTDLKRLKRERESGRTAVLSTVEKPRLPSLAVLAFTNMSADKENEYFCDGLSEEIINALCNIRGLRIAARTSAFSFKGKEVDIREVGEKLNVSTVLEGSVRKSGQRLRITAQLINVEDGCHIWSGQFDKEMKDIFDIQEEISLTIVDRLKLELLKGEKEKILKRSTENPEAYECYLKGRHIWNRRNMNNFPQGLQYFQQAIEKDPDFALPYVGIADTFAILGGFGFLAPHHAYTQAKNAAQKALRLDPDLAEVQATLGWIAMFYDRDWPASEKHFLKAIQMKPEYALAHHWYKNYLMCMGRIDEAIQEMRVACSLEPHDSINPAHLGQALGYSGRLDESIEVLEKVIESDPQFALAHFFQAGSFAAKGMWKETIAGFQKTVELTSGAIFALSTLGFAYGAVGMKDKALEILKQLDDSSGERYVGPLWKAMVWMGLGKKSQALDNLEKAYEERESFLVFMNIQSIYNSLRSEPRYKNLLRKMNLNPCLLGHTKAAIKGAIIYRAKMLLSRRLPWVVGTSFDKVNR
jgi:eukaryotic-like serine/threonine-protein kinase